MSSIVQFNFPTIIRFGKDVSKEIPAYLKSNGCTKPLIVSDPGLVELPFFKAFLKVLADGGLDAKVYSGISKNPVKTDVHKGSEFFHETSRDAIVGLGGGASLDVARAITLKVHNPKDLFHYEEGRPGEAEISEKVPHFICVPTTAGTGSEVGRSAIISDDETHAKKIIFHPSLMAKMVFADPEMTMGLPPFITAATGMDALTHNVEALVAKNYHPMCEGIALEGIKLIAKSIETATHSPDYQSRADMLLGSMMGAIAFQKGLGVVHSLAHPMSTLLDTHHGLANAINLPYGIRFNYDVAKEKLDEVARIFKTDDLVQTIFDLNEKLGLPTKLSGAGVKEEHLEQLSVLAINDFCHPNNPKPVTQDDFLKLYKEAL